MTEQETIRILTTLFLQYPGIEVETALVKLWHRALGHYSAEEVSAAVMEVLLTHASTFAPTIAHVAQVLRKSSEQAESTLSEGEAWQILLHTIKRFGRYNQAGAMFEIRRQSALVERVVNTMGWPEICSWRSDDEVSNRAHFWRILAGLRQTTEAKAFQAPERAGQIGSVMSSLMKGISYAGR
ncbi:Replicative helicase inhibitor G39P, N-terminal [uncultured Caudovirales phage]|uniref:Replicative helicase inhibitor G39P, N-terminal n=1 Tax=uncultured Caudovirales phage TaxID=2100421 RepID=A0A6J5SYH3_9CAUD|nr:Replicative helicase inhibitor G39P, N-terminal [uncultured Caudovirales phage]